MSFKTRIQIEIVGDTAKIVAACKWGLEKALDEKVKELLEADEREGTNTLYTTKVMAVIPADKPYPTNESQ